MRLGARLRCHPHWSPKALTCLAVLASLLTVMLVFGLSAKPALSELQLTFQILGGGLFALLALGLYRGTRIRREQLKREEVQEISKAVTDKVSENIDVTDLPGADSIASVADDHHGCLAVLLWIALALLLWAGFIALELGLLPLLIAGIYWICYRAFRIVFLKSHRCHGRLLPSLGWAAVYSVLYMGWLIVLLVVANHL